VAEPLLDLPEDFFRGLSRLPEEKKAYHAIGALLELIPDDGDFIQKLFKIVDKRSRLVPFKFNQAQLELLRVIQRLESEGRRIMLCVLKGRQMGCSIFLQAFLLMKALRQENSNCLVIADQDKNSRYIFGLAKRMFLSLIFQPKTKYSTKEELIFEDPLGSRYWVETARNFAAGRSRTIQHVHLSEVAYFPNASATMTSLAPALVDTPGNWMVFESTANGYGDYFYEKWKQAESGETDLVPVFLPWYWSEEYQEPEGSTYLRDIREGPLDEEETVLREKYRVDDPHIAWRRWYIANKADGVTEVFHQEFPTTPEEAFLVSGRCVFPTGAIESMLARKPEPLWKGELEVNLQEVLHATQSRQEPGDGELEHP